MTRSPRPKPLGRLPKRPRSNAEINAAARNFAGDWAKGDSVQTWINRREGASGDLSRMIRDGWSWEDISRAMFKARICYRTGRPIPQKTLRGKAYDARVKFQPAPEPGMMAPVAIASLPASTRSPASGRSAASLRDVESAPLFELVTRRDGQRPTQPTPPSLRRNHDCRNRSRLMMPARGCSADDRNYRRTNECRQTDRNKLRPAQRP